MKRKPKQIVVEYIDPETGQKTKTIVDKVIKKKVTSLKKAIIKKREIERLNRLQRKEEKRQLREEKERNAVTQGEATDGYVTIDEEVIHSKNSIAPYQSQLLIPDTDGESAASVSAAKTTMLKDGGGIPYKPIFNDLDTIFDEIKQEMTMVKSKQFSDNI